MNYRVYDHNKKRFVADDSIWVLKPEGSLVSDYYGNMIAIPQNVILCLEEQTKDTFDKEVNYGH